MVYPSLRSILYLAVGIAVLAQMLVFPFFSQLHSPQLGLIATELSVLCLSILFVRRQQVAAEELLLLNATSLRTLALTLPLAISTSLLINQFDLHLSHLLSAFGYSLPLHIQHNLIEIQLAGDLPAVLWGVAAVVVTPGVCEEILFRGLVFTGLYVHRGPRMAVVGAALLFALVHFNPWQLPTLFLMGASLSLLVYWTHSIYPAILAHTVNNALSFAGLNLKVYWDIETLSANHSYSMPVLLGLGLVCCAAALRLHRQKPVMPLPPPLHHPIHLLT